MSQNSGISLPPAGRIAVIEDGDIIEIDIPRRKLSLNVDDAQLAQRRAERTPFELAVPPGVMRSCRKHVRTASEGAALD